MIWHTFVFKTSRESRVEKIEPPRCNNTRNTSQRYSVGTTTFAGTWSDCVEGQVFKVFISSVHFGIQCDLLTKSHRMDNSIKPSLSSRWFQVRLSEPAHPHFLLRKVNCPAQTTILVCWCIPACQTFRDDTFLLQSSMFLGSDLTTAHRWIDI